MNKIPQMIRRDVFINKDAPQFLLREEDEEDQIISKDLKEDLETLQNQQNISNDDLSQPSISSGVNFINVLRTNFSYEHCFGSFSLFICT
jgi:hypothetical protein